MRCSWEFYASIRIRMNKQGEEHSARFIFTSRDSRPTLVDLKRERGVLLGEGAG